MNRVVCGPFFFSVVVHVFVMCWSFQGKRVRVETTCCGWILGNAFKSRKIFVVYVMSKSTDLVLCIIY